MCGRYALYETEHLADRFNLATKPSAALEDSYNIAPGQFLPIVINSETGNKLLPMKWGLVPFWAKDIKIGYKLINARAETAFSKPMWRSSIRHYRCLVPASGFYEWLVSNNKTKQPYYIHPKDQKLFAFAGLWSTYKDASGNELNSFTIITTEPNKEMSAVHNRMPVILKPSNEAAWLEPSLDDKTINELMHPYEDNGLEIYKVSADVNSPKINDKHLIYALNE